MNGVVLQEIDQVVVSHEGVVDGGNDSPVGLLEHGAPERESANSAESVDSHFHDGHLFVLPN